MNDDLATFAGLVSWAVDDHYRTPPTVHPAGHLGAGAVTVRDPGRHRDVIAVRREFLDALLARVPGRAAVSCHPGPDGAVVVRAVPL